MAWVSNFRSRPAVGSPPSWTAPPSIIGTPQDGVASSFTDGTAVNGTSFITQWFVDGVYVGNGSTYTPITANVGKSLTVDRVEINAYGTKRTSSAGVTIIAAAGGAGAAAYPPNIVSVTYSAPNTTITWQNPEALANGQDISLAPITGLKIYRAATADAANPTDRLTEYTPPNPTDTTYVISGLGSGDHWFAMDDVNPNDTSNLSNAVKVTI